MSALVSQIEAGIGIANLGAAARVDPARVDPARVDPSGRQRSPPKQEGMDRAEHAWGAFDRTGADVVARSLASQVLPATLPALRVREWLSARRCGRPRRRRLCDDTWTTQPDARAQCRPPREECPRPGLRPRGAQPARLEARAVRVWVWRGRVGCCTWRGCALLANPPWQAQGAGGPGLRLRRAGGAQQRWSSSRARGPPGVAPWGAQPRGAACQPCFRRQKLTALWVRQGAQDPGDPPHAGGGESSLTSNAAARGTSKDRTRWTVSERLCVLQRRISFVGMASVKAECTFAP